MGLEELRERIAAEDARTAGWCITRRLREGLPPHPVCAGAAMPGSGLCPPCHQAIIVKAEQDG